MRAERGMTETRRGEYTAACLARRGSVLQGRTDCRWTRWRL